MKRASTALILVILIGAGAICSHLWRKAEVLRAENQVLQARLQDLEEAAHQSPRSEDARSDPKEVQAQKLELMRLRNEVTQLRSARDAANKAETELARLRTAASSARENSPAGAPSNADRVAREDWKFAGFDSPQAAFLSGMSAMKDGQVEALLNTLTPEERQRFETNMQGKSQEEIAARFQKEYGRVTGVRILDQQESAPGEVVLSVYLEGVGGLKKYRMTQVGNEWKAGGPIDQNWSQPQNIQNEANDPLAFYRRNPELMKRYFPHLVEEAQKQAPQQ
jgi:hypothetical protein